MKNFKYQFIATMVSVLIFASFFGLIYKNSNKNKKNSTLISAAEKNQAIDQKNEEIDNRIKNLLDDLKEEEVNKATTSQEAQPAQIIAPKQPVQQVQGPVQPIVQQPVVQQPVVEQPIPQPRTRAS